jgi:hypothetical protein
MQQQFRLQIKRRAAVVLAAFLLLLTSANGVVLAQNLGGAPQVNVAVQGQTGAQPEGAFLNLVNWIGNVIAPVGAGLALAAGLVAYMSGRGAMRYYGGARMSGGIGHYACLSSGSSRAAEASRSSDRKRFRGTISSVLPSKRIHQENNAFTSLRHHARAAALSGPAALCVSSLPVSLSGGTVEQSFRSAAVFQTHALGRDLPGA